MTKVAYNACFGGFSLSTEAVKLGRELSGNPAWGDFTLVGEYYSDGTLCEGNALTDNSHHPYDLPRHDKTLVEVIERLAEKANGRWASLAIAQIIGTKYRIDEYDGNESVMEPDDYEWTEV